MRLFQHKEHKVPPLVRRLKRLCESPLDTYLHLPCCCSRQRVNALSNCIVRMSKDNLLHWSRYFVPLAVAHGQQCLLTCMPSYCMHAFACHSLSRCCRSLRTLGFTHGKSITQTFRRQLCCDGKRHANATAELPQAVHYWTWAAVQGGLAATRPDSNA